MRQIWCLFYGTDVRRTFVQCFAAERGAKLLTVKEAIETAQSEVEYKIVVDQPNATDWEELVAFAELREMKLTRLSGTYDDGVRGMFDSTEPRVNWVETDLES